MRTLMGCMIGTPLVAAPGWALVLCQKKSGAVFVRAMCKKKEKALDLAQFGALGPKGDPGTPGTPGAPGVGPLTTCPPDAALVGTTCVDKYEASVWLIPPDHTALVAKVQAGTVTLADLTADGATQLSPSPSCAPGFPVNFPDTGQWTPVLGSSPPSPGVYALSIPGVPPSACITWFQAAQACRVSGKRLVTNLEWQDAAAGTPDPGNTPGANDCNTNSGGPSNTGSRPNCKSSWGVFDMIANVDEWVADWADRATGCTDWTSQTGIAGGDESCFGGNGSGVSNNIPGALIRGARWTFGAGAGVFTVDATSYPSLSSGLFGFRCAR